MADAWSVQDAKAQLSELLRRARAGEVQHIGLSEPCVLVSEAEWAATRTTRLGAWLADSAPKGADLETPERGTRRGDPFAEDDPRA